MQERKETRRKAASLVVDLAFTAGAEEFVEVAILTSQVSQ